MIGISGLYAITPDTPDTDWLEERVRKALLGGASVLQYRNKAAASALKLEQARRLRRLCAEFSVPFLVNDDVGLALAVDADGAHIGINDGPLAAARKQLSGKLLGVSCYNDPQYAVAAKAAGADYVAFGSFFASGTKPDAVSAKTEILGSVKSSLDLPVVAIGGITVRNGRELIAAGADAIAVISAVFFAEDVEAAAKNFCNLFTRSKKS